MADITSFSNMNNYIISQLKAGSLAVLAAAGAGNLTVAVSMVGAYSNQRFRGYSTCLGNVRGWASSGSAWNYWHST